MGLGGVFLLASCVDLKPTPSLSSDVLRHFAHSFRGTNFTGHVVLDDRNCPTLCDTVLPLGLLCHSAAELSNATDTRIASLEGDCGNCVGGWTWQALLPSLLRGGAAKHYDYVWVVEFDVGYIGGTNATWGNWTSLFSRYDTHDRNDFISSSPNGVRACGNTTALGPPSEETNWCHDAMRRGNWTGNLEEAPFNMSLYHSYLFITRFSARLVNAAVDVLNRGGWAYVEVFWPTVCVSEIADCATGMFAPEDYSSVTFEPEPNENISRVRDGLIIALDRSEQPDAEFVTRGTRLIHPVKWQQTADASRTDDDDDDEHQDVEEPSDAEWQLSLNRLPR